MAGRPEIGGHVHTALGEELLARVDQLSRHWVDDSGTRTQLSRAEAIRVLLDDALSRREPETEQARQRQRDAARLLRQEMSYGHGEVPPAYHLQSLDIEKAFPALGFLRGRRQAEESLRAPDDGQVHLLDLDTPPSQQDRAWAAAYEATVRAIALSEQW